MDILNWHSTYYSSDYYARYSYDGGSTYTSAVKIQGVDGQDGTDGTHGSDANVPAWVSSMQATYIDNKWVISPNIYDGKITSGTTIDVTTDATIGNNLYFGLGASASSTIYFGDSKENAYVLISCDPIDGNITIGYPDKTNGTYIALTHDANTIMFNGTIIGLTATAVFG